MIPALTGLPELLQERLTSLERGLPEPPSGLSLGQTARIYSPLKYLKTLEPLRMDDPEEAKDKWRAARNFRVKGNNSVTSGGLVAALDQFKES